MDENPTTEPWNFRSNGRSVVPRNIINLTSWTERDALSIGSNFNDFSFSIRLQDVQCAIVLVRPKWSHVRACVSTMIGSSKWKNATYTLTFFEPLESESRRMHDTCSCSAHDEGKISIYKLESLDNLEARFDLQSITSRNIAAFNENDIIEEWSVIGVPSLSNDSYRL